MTDIDNKLLELQEQEQKEQDNLNLQFDQGGNGYNKEDLEASIVKEGLKQDQEQEKVAKKLEQKKDEDEELAKNKLTKEDIDFMFQTIMKESKYDELSVKQTVHGFNSAFTRLPIPHIFTSKESGAGKSYIVNHVAGFYPDKYLTRLAGVSDKALFHLDGPMIVIEDEETGEFELLDDIVSRLETEMEECEEEIKVQQELKNEGKP